MFIPIKSGKNMPCDPKLFIAKESDDEIRIVLSDGTVQSGVQQGDVGHIVHWDTCTAPK
jgi:hypothetical protein